MHKIKFVILGISFFILEIFSVNAQELKARVTVLSNQVNSTVDRKVFQTLQSALNNLLINGSGQQMFLMPMKESNAVF